PEQRIPRVPAISRPSPAPRAPRPSAGWTAPARTRGPRSAIALVLSVVVAAAGGGVASASPRPVGLNAPIHAFAWPLDAPPNDPYFVLQTDLAPIGVAAAWT